MDDSGRIAETPQTQTPAIVRLEVIKKKPRKHDQRFSITEFLNASGTTSFRVAGYKRTGERVRENFAEQVKAQTRQLELETEYLRGEAKTEIQATWLGRDQISLAEAAFNRLGVGHHEELPDAIEHWLRSGRSDGAEVESPRLDDAFTQFCEWLLKGSGLRPLSRENLRRRVNLFVSGTRNVRVAEVTPERLEHYLGQRAVSAKSKDNDRRAVGRFLSWCAERPRKWIATNPARDVKIAQPESGAPVILSHEQCSMLLRAAEAHKQGALIPYVVLCLFGGLRPFEVARLKWKQVNLDDAEIRLDALQTKTGTSRVVSISDTLKAWLDGYRRKPICPANWRRDLDAIKEAAGLVKRKTARSKKAVTKKKKGKLVQAHRYWKTLVPLCWAPDIMRHTAISHYFRHCGSYGRTAEQFGNSEAIIKKHYQGRVTSEDTRKFYALLPRKKCGKKSNRGRSRHRSHGRIPTPEPS